MLARLTSRFTFMRIAAGFVLASGAGVFCLAGTGAPAPGPLAEAEVESRPCVDEIQHLVKRVVWYGTRNRALIEADSACSDRYGMVFELRNVHVVIFSGARRVADLVSPSGLLSDRTNRVVLTGAEAASPEAAKDSLPCLIHPSVMTLDLRQGVVKGPALYLKLNHLRPLRCGVES
jgi:hypothetical protein